MQKAENFNEKLSRMDGSYAEYVNHFLIRSSIAGKLEWEWVAVSHWTTMTTTMWNSEMKLKSSPLIYMSIKQGINEANRDKRDKVENSRKNFIPASLSLLVMCLL